MVRRIFVLLMVVLLGAGLMGPAHAQTDPPAEDVTAEATLDKTASETEVEPGETFTYTLTIGCSSITDVGCKDAVLSDTVPAPFVVTGAEVGGGANSADDPVIEGNTVTVNWTTPLGDGSVGILDATTATVEIMAQLPEDASYDANGVAVTNNAVIEGSNFNHAAAEVAVTPVIPLNLATTPTKAFDPDTALATAGTPVSAALGATNDSNATVESLVIQDPTDPTVTPNPFDSLAFTGFGTVTPPDGTTSTTYEVYVAGTWVPAPNGELPAEVSAADVKGTRVTFTGEIPSGATASVDLELETTEETEGQPDGTVVTNPVQSRVTLGEESATGEASDDFTLQANEVTVVAGKSFDPELVVAGQPSTVTISGRNDSSIAIESMTIREPSAGTFPAEYTFGGIDGGIAYPSGATSGTVIYHLAGGTSEEVPFADGATPAAPSGSPSDVEWFEVVFEGSISPGGETSIPFVVETDPDLSGLPVTTTNEVAVTGENSGVTGRDTAVADLYLYDEVIETYIDKTIRPSQILAVPGEVVTVSLSGGLTERPNPPETETGSTGNADRIVIQDPADPVEPDDWWNAFDITAITQTPIPADSTLTIEYYDTTDGTWKTLDGPIPGADVYSAPVPADVRDVAGGIRFVYDYTGEESGFPPGTDLAPNFTSSLRAEGRYEAGPPYSQDQSTFVPNCAQSDATSPTQGVPDASTRLPADECPEIELIPADPGNADLVDKTFGTSSSGSEKAVIARSGNTIPSTLGWSTGGFSNLERVEVTDIADPEGTAVADSMYDAFDLIRVQPITSENDPYIAYDQVQQVQLWNGTEWVGATNDPCPDNCIGQFPGMDLTGAEQASTLGVRLIFVESPNRAAASEGNLDAPPVGSGVARSFGNTRPITLTWRVRDTKRSDGSPALGEDTYNLADAGVVRNTVRAEGYPASGGDPLVSQDSDDVVITDVPITTTTSKTWEGGPVAAPANADIPPSEFPLSRITVTTHNTTPARVDQLVITDPAPGSVTDRTTDPFQAFRLNNIATITVPQGTQNTVVTLFCPDGSAPTYSRDDALALVPDTMPCDVTGVQVAFDGRIVADSAGVLAFDVRLRAYWRGTEERVTAEDSPISDTAEGVVADIDAIEDCPPPQTARYACDQGSATIEIVEGSFGITAGKEIEPAEQQVGDFAPVTVTISMQNSGATNPFLEVITDDDPTFWNAVDFVGMDPSWTLPTPVGRVQACYLDGGAFTEAAVENDTVGGDWTCQAVRDEMPLAEAVAFMESAPSTLHGLRFRFTAGDETGWQNPHNPLIEVPFQVERREDLRTGDPVPTTRSDQTPAPGETDAGVFVDTVEAHGESVLVGVDQRLTADDTADAQYRHVHQRAGVSVTKEPTGDVRPGEVIPFTLSFTNTGEAALTNPVFTDELPTDEQGAQLIFDPDRDPTQSPYSFELTGPAPDPPHGSPLPTEESQIEIEESEETIVFRMPEGSVLEPGQTYTITIELMLRPGLTPNDDVQNWAVIDADEPFDECETTLDSETGECKDDTVVSPLAVSALSTVKYVKADEPPNEPGIPQTISTSEDYSCEDAANADGFYRAPCIPVTLPGDTETWRFTVTNSGTLPVDQLVSMDNLPTPGDQGVIVGTPRGSEWPVTFAGDVQLITSDGTETAALTTYYSTETQPCTDDLAPLGPQCPPGSWQPLDGSVDPATVRSLKFEIDFEGDRFDPGEQISIQFRTRTTPEAAAETDYPIAWNTVATGGTAVANEQRTPVPATEGRRVGVTYPIGPIQLRKVVEGGGSEFAPDTFLVQLECTSGGNPVEGLPEVELTPGAEPTQVDGLPWGAECTASEGDHGQDATRISTAVVGGTDDEVGLVTVTNVYGVTGLEITKKVTSSAVDQDGNPVSYGPFEVSAECEFNGNPVYAEGYGPDQPMVRELADGETWVLAGLPRGAVCAVEETDDAGAAEVIITPDGGADVPATEDVTVENVYDVGSIALKKETDGRGAEDFGAGPFTMHVECELDDASGTRTVYNADVVLGGRQPLEKEIGNLATGAECTVTEVDTAGAHETSIEPETVTVGDGDVSEVTVTNTFNAGSLVVAKDIEGPGAERYGAGPFVVTLSCTRETDEGPVELAIPGGAERTLSGENDYTATYDPLLLDAECQLEETGTGGANQTVIVDGEGEETNQFTISDPETPTEARVVNTFLLGSIEVTKTVVGDGAGPFTVDLECATDVDGTSTPVEIPGGAERTLSADDGLTATYDELPVGAACTLTETDSGGADGTTITPNIGDPAVGAVIVEAGAAANIQVENSFRDEPPEPQEPGTVPPGGQPPAADGPGAPTGDDLPDTGVSSGLIPTALFALGLVAFGAFLLVMGRRKRGMK